MMKNVDDIIDIKDYAITLSISMTKVICNSEGLVQTIEKMFTSLREYAATSEEKVEYDRMRALLKYADTLRATRCELKHYASWLTVTLHFNDIENMLKFQEGMAEVIESTAMN